ncbi:predicted protein [Nematostella vectensis]|uniref:WD repeat-containing protein 11 n=1 Tax=Nematostella vectensis TaxID=45351 RepID=A7SHF1_NEMVE|nr:predicted protein [Nematostella vectensis]|eukprot:XP_001628943.1 predicted protein [Nematostella vectensis]
MKLSPRVIPGALHAQNKGACDWGWQSLVAYGCHNHVVVFDPKSMQVIQVLDLHVAPCTRVKWGRENYHHDFASPYTLRLASGDASGRIIVWDIAQGQAVADFIDSPSKTILDLEWLGAQDACHDLLVALHAPSSMILWNADTGTKLWKKTFQENLICFAFDPFSPSNVTLMCQDWILFIDDFSINKAPESNGRRFYLTSSGTASPSNSGIVGGSGQVSSRTSTPRSALARVRPGEESVALSECLQLSYLPSSCHNLLALFPREVMILDMEINQAICSFSLERNSPPFLQVIPCRQRDVLMCLHENGSIIMRARRRVTQNPYFNEPNYDNTDSNISVDIIYETKCQSDALRLSKSSRIFGFVCDPISERTITMVISDGRVVIWNLKANKFQTPDTDFMSEEAFKASIPIVSEFSDGVQSPVLTLEDMVPPLMTSGKPLPYASHFKFLMSGLLSSISAPPTCAVMCPPLTTKNWASYKPLVAIGNTHGCIQVFNLSTGLLTKEYSIHTGPVRGITWTGLSAFISWSQTSGISSKNEIQMLDLKTGHASHLAIGKSAEESTIEAVKVSNLKQYLFIVFKDKPIQLWDLKNLTVLKEMPKNFPSIVSLEWSPSHHSKHLKKKQAQQMEAAGATDIAANILNPTQAEGQQSQVLDSIISFQEPKSFLLTWLREHFVCVDANGLLYHFLVEGSTVKDGSKVQCDSTLGIITTMAWKGDILVLADGDGNLSVWELKARITRLVNTHRGQIKKVKFAPGRGNFKLAVLFNDGMDVWDLHQIELHSSYKIGKEGSPSVDMDWLASDLPYVIQSSGCLQVMDLELKTCTSSMNQMDQHDPIWCPHVMESKSALIMKTILQHQLGRDKQSMDNIQDLELSDELTGSIQRQLNLLPPAIASFLPVSPLGTAQKCLLAARLFGDEAEAVFWDVALHYLRREKARLSCNMTAKEENGASDDCRCYPVSLDNCYEILCDTDAFQKAQLDRTALHDSKRSTYGHTRKCAEALVLLGQADRAVQLFLETDATNENYYVDSLRACLVATIRSSGASQSTIKLVATNLIASGKLTEGIQLLCLIDKGLDACRYLQTYGEWQRSASLAKATLNYPDCAEVMRRWIEHLSSTHTSQQSKAVLVLLSLGKFHKALEMLHSMRYFDRAALFAEACHDFGFFLNQDESSISLVENVYAEYARYLQGLGLRKAALYFGSKAGDKGRQFLEGI